MQIKYILRNCLLRYEKKTSFQIVKVCLAWKKNHTNEYFVLYAVRQFTLKIVLPQALGREPLRERERESVKWEK